MYDFCIIGCGAAGMAAALAYHTAAPDGKICIIEKNEKAGRKLYATGNGRCNLSNMQCPGAEKTIAFFQRLGIMTRADEEGRVYPASESAADLVQMLEKHICAAGIPIITDAAVTDAEKQDGLFSAGGRRSKKLLIAAGGKAGPQFGSTGDGYRMARAFGHAVNRTYPVLTGIETDGTCGISGVRAKGKVSLLLNDAVTAEEQGEIQFNDYGLSGICIMNLSRFIRLSRDVGFGDYALVLDLAPGMDEGYIEDFLAEKKKLPGMTVADLFRSVINRRVAGSLARTAGVQIDGRAAEADDCKIREMAVLMKHWKLPVTGARGWKQAQCTGGGIPYDQVDPETMESRLVSGLYFAGEIMDYDGPCGGFNLEHAWETGIRAGTAAGRG